MVIALLSSLIMGITLGLLGAGGSILTVPILIYFMHVPDKLAILESLIIIGIIAFLSASVYWIRKEIDWESVLYFGLPGMIGAYLGASFASEMSASTQLVLFGLIMWLVSWTMLVGERALIRFIPTKSSLRRLMIQGLLVGMLTGLIGVGGGFLIVPTLVIWNHLPMKQAVGTSLFIIALNASVSFIKQSFTLPELFQDINWHIILIFSLVGTMGSITGIFFSKKFSPLYLKRLFGSVVLSIGTFILFQQGLHFIKNSSLES